MYHVVHVVFLKYQNIDLALQNPTRKQNLNATMRLGHVKLTHTLVTRTN